MTLEMIEKLFLSGADVFRLNFSHGEHHEKEQLMKLIRQIERKYNHPIAILADLQVPHDVFCARTIAFLTSAFFTAGTETESRYFCGHQSGADPGPAVLIRPEECCR
jgi:hypothetical protein